MKKNLCESASYFYYSFINGDTADIPAGVLTHINNCENCKDQIKELAVEISASETEIRDKYLLTAKHMDLDFSYLNQPVNCDSAVSFIPSMIALGIRRSLNTPINHHINNCENCEDAYEKIDFMDLGSRNLFLIGQAVNSDYTNIDEIKEKATVSSEDFSKAINILKAASENQNSTTLQGYSRDDNVVLVEKAHRRNSGEAKHRFLNRVIKPVAVAAAIMLAIFVFNQSSATAINLKDIYSNLLKFNYFNVVEYGIKGEKIQEKWISVPDRTVIYVSGVKLSSETQIAVKSVYETGLLPFVDLSLVPEGSSWQKESADNVIDSLENANNEVYSLVWKEKTASGNDIIKRWVCEIDPGTYKIEKVVWQRSYSDSKVFETISTSEIHYPTQKEYESIRQLAEESFGKP